MPPRLRTTRTRSPNGSVCVHNTKPIQVKLDNCCEQYFTFRCGLNTLNATPRKAINSFSEMSDFITVTQCRFDMSDNFLSIVERWSTTKHSVYSASTTLLTLSASEQFGPRPSDRTRDAVRTVDLPGSRGPQHLQYDQHGVMFKLRGLAVPSSW
jgi:hypothetical protein